MAEDKEPRVPSFPAGVYRAFADGESVSIGCDEGKQTEQICVRIRVSDKDPHIECLGMSILWYGNDANQEAIEITVKALKCMGWDGVSPIGTAHGCLAGLGGVEFMLTVQHQTWGGKTRAKAVYLNPIAGRFEFGKPIDDTRLARLNDRFFRHMGATAPQQRAATPPRAQEPKSAHRPEHRTYAAEPPPTKTANRPLVSDEDRLRAIDRGEEPPRAVPHEDDRDESGYDNRTDDDGAF